MNQGITYAVDIVLCIDLTGSMYPIIDRVKESALSFNDQLRAALEADHKHIDQLRVRVIGFRDFYFDGKESIEASDFFDLPADNARFSAFVRGLHATGGGDEPETGLEALALAIRSPWSKSTARSRQVIVVWTDASAHPLDKDAGAKPGAYPQDLPADLDELTDWWEGQTYLNHRSKRLVIYAPDAAGWSEIGTTWDNTLHCISQAGAGLKDHEYTEILDSIANSV